MLVRLFRKSSNGSLGFWEVSSSGDTITISHATSLSGCVVQHTEKVVPKGGRTLEQQIESRIKSRVSVMRDKGYKDSIDLAEQSSSTNQLGYSRPMLAKSMSKISNLTADKLRGAVIQKKLNGHRCLITKEGDQLVAYSRQGKIIDSISHILGHMQNWSIPEGFTFDGELYCHGHSLQTLASWIKRKQPNTSKLSYVVYDCIDSAEYMDRHDMLTDLFNANNQSNHVLLLKYQILEGGVEDAQRIAKTYIDNGFEGAMIRMPGVGYEIGKRSSSLIKVKQGMDAEFTCVGVTSSADNWGVLVLCDDEGRTFSTPAPGTIEDKIECLQNSSKYIGRKIRLTFFEYTDEKIPFHITDAEWYDEV